MPPVGSSGETSKQTLQQHVQKRSSTIIKTLPKRNNRTGRLVTDLDSSKHPDFVYALPNPTIHGLGAVGQLDPLPFQALGSFLVICAPDIYWKVKVCCPLCERAAKPHGWCPGLRRVHGVQHTYYIAARRYRCDNCPGKESKPTISIAIDVNNGNDGDQNDERY
jgi:hypothetical protein